MTSTAATIDVLLRANTAAYRTEMVNAARVATQNLGAIRKEAASTAVSIANLNRAAAGFIGFEAVRAGVSALLDAQKSIQQIHYGLQGATGSAAAADKAYGFVTQTAKELGLNLEDAAKSFTRMTAAASANGIGMRDQQELFRELSRSATVMHLSSDEMGRATTALGQSFGKGKFQAEELRQQLGEAIPGVVPRFMQAVAKMNEGTSLAGKSFDKLLQDGDLNVQKYLPAMIQALRETGAGAEEASKGLNAELNRLSTAWFKLKADTSSGLFSDAATTSVRLMAENLQNVAGAATLAAGVIAGRLVGAGLRTGYSAVSSPISDRIESAKQASAVAALAQERAKEAAQQVNQARESLRLTTAWRAQAVAGQEVARGEMAIAYAANEAAERTLEHQSGAAALSANLRAQREAQAAASVAQRNLARAQAEYNAAVASGTRADAAAIAAKGRLIAAQEAAAVATNSLAAARVKESAAGAASSLGGMLASGARTAGAGLMALAGGPWGAAAIAIGAMGMAFADMSRKSEEARKEYQEQIKGLDLLRLSMSDTVDQYNRGGKSIGQLAEEWNSSSQAMKQNEERIKALQAAVDNYQGRIRLAQTSTREGSGLTIAADYEGLQKAQDELAKFQASVAPVRTRFLELQDTLKGAIDPKLFAALREAAIKADDVTFNKLLAQLSDVDRAGINAAESVRKISLAGGDDIWTRQLARLKREQGEYQSWLATEAKKYMTAYGTNSAEEAFAKLRKDPVEFKSFQDRAKFVREDVAAEKAWNEQQKANKAATRSATSEANQQENGYQSLIESIQKRIAADKESLLYTDRMTEAERMAAKARADSNYEKAGKDQKAYLDGLLKEAVDAGRAARAHDQLSAAIRETIDLRRQQQQEYSSTVANDDLDVASFGMTSEGAERARRMVDEQLRYQREMDQIRSRYDEREQTDELKAEMAKQLDDAKSHHDRMVIEEQDYQDRVEQARADWTQGAAVAFREYQESARDASKQAYDAFSNVFSGLEDTIVDFVKTGKLSFSNFADSIIADMARIAARQAVTGVFGGGGTSGSLLDLFSTSWMNYDTGGYTGPGGKKQAAGVVHKGEVVFSQADVARHGGVYAVEAMRLGLRGYADGSAVGVVSRVPVGSSAAGGVTVNIHENADRNEVKTRSANGGLQIDVWLKSQMRSALASGDMDGPMQRYGVSPKGSR